MVVPRTDERKFIYGRPRSPGISDRKRQHKSTEVCVMGAIEIIGRSRESLNLSKCVWFFICTIS